MCGQFINKGRSMVALSKKINKCFIYNIDREVGRIVFMGEIDTESKIYDLFSVYFRHLEIDKSLIFKSLIES